MLTVKKFLFFLFLFSVTSSYSNILLNSEIPSLAPMLDNVTPAVVNIYTFRNIGQEKNSSLDDPFFRKFLNIPKQEENTNNKNRSGLGSGVIIDSNNGYIVTNNHVIAKASDIKVKLSDGREFKATLVGADPAADIAVIKIPSKNLKALKFADSEKLRVGDFVVAIGNPFGIGQTVTSGIVSALGRSGLGIEAYENFIQTDASINPGNSGGALVNLKGELVGINTAIIGSKGAAGSVGIGLAIPINMTLDITEQLIKYGEVKRGYLGVSAQDLTEDLAKAFEIKKNNGVIITEVKKDSPADIAKIKIGDVVLKINNKNIGNVFAMRNEIGLLKLNSTISMELSRKGKIFITQVKITAPEKAQINNLKINSRLAGITFKEINDNMHKNEITSGLRIIQINKDSYAYIAGLRPNDIILSVNNIPVQKVSDLEIVSGKNDSQIVLHVQRENISAFILLK